MTGSGGHLFVSYAHADKAYTDTLVMHLREDGFEVWTDAAVACGDKWTRAIQKKIDSCAAFIVVMSPAADESEWVEREVHHAQTRGKRIFPLLLSGTPLFAVNNLQYEDVQGGVMPSPRWVDHLRKTVDGRENEPAGTESRS